MVLYKGYMARATGNRNHTTVIGYCLAVLALSKGVNNSEKVKAKEFSKVIWREE